MTTHLQGMSPATVRIDGTEPGAAPPGATAFTVPKDWKVRGLVSLSDKLGLLLLEDEATRPVAWLLDEEQCILGSLDDIASRRPDDMVRCVSDALLPAILALLRDSATPAEAAVIRDLAGLAPPLRYSLLGLLNPLHVLQAPGASAAGPHRTAGRLVPWPAEPREIYAALADYGLGAVRPLVTVPRARIGGEELRLRHLPLFDASQTAALLCWTADSGRTLLLIQRRLASGRILYVAYDPDGCLDESTSFDKADETAAIQAIQDVFDAILRIPPSQGGALHRVDCGGIILQGLRHIAHALWEELQALDRLAEGVSRWPWSGPHQTGQAAWLADCSAMNSRGERMRKPE